MSNSGKLFDDAFLAELRDRFCFVDTDPARDNAPRLFFDNAGGSFRLKNAMDQFVRWDSLPDCPERIHETAKIMQKIQDRALDDVRMMFNVDDGSVLTFLTASMAIFEMTRVIAENVPGTNIVTTLLEHPSAYDSAKFYADKLGKELRAAKTNRITGGVDVEAITSLIDENTSFLSVIYASNISGAILDLEAICREARKIKPDLFIICDAVQHMPHGAIDLQKSPIDAINFAPYKFFGVRGMGIGYMSPRAAKLPHHKLLAKPEGEWELGSPADGHFAALSAVVDYVCWIGERDTASGKRRDQFVAGMNAIALHERALMRHMLTGVAGQHGLRDIAGVKVFLDYEDLSTRDLILAIGFDNLEYQQAVREYEKRGVIVFERVATSLYSVRMLESFGMDGAVRISPLHCHNLNDIRKFLETTAEIAKL